MKKKFFIAFRKNTSQVNGPQPRTRQKLVLEKAEFLATYFLLSFNSFYLFSLRLPLSSNKCPLETKWIPTGKSKSSSEWKTPWQRNTNRWPNFQTEYDETDASRQTLSRTWHLHKKYVWRANQPYPPTHTRTVGAETCTPQTNINTKLEKRLSNFHERCRKR